MNLERIKDTIEMMRERAKNPLYNSLETGFRHSPLTTSEQLQRYRKFSEEVKADCEAILKEISS
jgi:hypothetical protein